MMHRMAILDVPAEWHGEVERPAKCPYQGKCCAVHVDSWETGACLCVGIRHTAPDMDVLGLCLWDNAGQRVDFKATPDEFGSLISAMGAGLRLALITWPPYLKELERLRNATKKGGE
jgi:hypothetical protein